MALVGDEHWSRGFVFSDAAGTTLAWVDVLLVLETATEQNGFLRDPDGRLAVELLEPGEYDRGFLRFAGALHVENNESTPPLYPFA